MCEGDHVLEMLTVSVQAFAGQHTRTRLSIRGPVAAAAHGTCVICATEPVRTQRGAGFGVDRGTQILVLDCGPHALGLSDHRRNRRLADAAERAFCAARCRFKLCVSHLLLKAEQRNLLRGQIVQDIRCNDRFRIRAPRDGEQIPTPDQSAKLLDRDVFAHRHETRRHCGAHDQEDLWVAGPRLHLDEHGGVVRTVSGGDLGAREGVFDEGLACGLGHLRSAFCGEVCTHISPQTYANNPQDLKTDYQGHTTTGHRGDFCMANIIDYNRVYPLHGVLGEYKDNPQFASLLDLILEKFDNAELDDDSYNQDEITAWVYLSLTENEPWILHVNAQGLPHKIAKCGTMERLHKEAEKFLSKWIQKKDNLARVHVKDHSSKNIIVSLPNGYKWVKISTLSDLILEGERMRNCLGNGKYDYRLLSGKYKFYSLRNEKDQPQIDLVLDRWGALEYFSSHNKKVTLREFSLFLPLMKALGREAYWWMEYAVQYKKGRIKFQETLIKTDPFALYKYTKAFFEHGWIPAERHIKESPLYAMAYVRDVIKKPHPDFEEIIMSNAVSASYYAARVLKKRWEDAEDIISTDALSAYVYAKDVLNTRWPKGEASIIQDSEISKFYAEEVLESRWQAAEDKIFESLELGYMYCKDVLKGRSLKFEKIALSYETPDARIEAAHWCGLYAQNVMRSPWPEAEHIIQTRSRIWSQYSDFVQKNMIKIYED